MLENHSIQIALLIAASYGLGSIPNGLLLARFKGVDLQKSGSGNIGATNVYRCVGKGWGVAAFILDAIKGFVPAFIFPLLITDPPSWLGLACGGLAVSGHNWPAWLKFKGGKGVSTSAGMLLGIAPGAVGIGFGVFAIVVFLSRYVSLASICAAIAVPIAFYWQNGSSRPVLLGALILMGLLVVVKHRANIRRLIAGTEPKITGKKQP